MAQAAAIHSLRRASPKPLNAPLVSVAISIAISVALTYGSTLA